jgi:hypothetical protein
MSRTVPAALLTALAQPEVQPFYAVELLLDAGPVRLWTGYGDRTIDGETYTGSGNLLNIEGLSEVADLSAQAITISLSGVAQELVALSLIEPYQRRKCRVLFGVVNVADVVEVFSGSLNTMTIEDGGDTSVISAMIDSKLVETEKASNLRYTSETQKTRNGGAFSNDTFFDYVSAIQDAEIVWGRKSA